MHINGIASDKEKELPYFTDHRFDVIEDLYFGFAAILNEEIIFAPIISDNTSEISSGLRHNNAEKL